MMMTMMMIRAEDWAASIALDELSLTRELYASMFQVLRLQTYAIAVSSENLLSF